MNINDTTEQAYRNGYEQGKKDAHKHGHWIVSDKFFFRIDGRGNCWYEIQCSNCNAVMKGCEKTPYCANCGAKMDEEV